MIRPTLTFLAAAATLAQAASADLITWGPVEEVTGTSDVSTSGTLVAARNCWAQTFAAPTVNGVAFDAFAPLGWSNGGWTLNAGSSTGDAEYDALLDSARVTSGGSAGNPTGYGAIQLDTLAQLTVGNEYEIQVWYSDQRTGTATNVLFDRVMNLSSATGAAVTTGGLVTNLSSLVQGAVSGGLDADPNNLAGATDTIVGSLCTGTFTRTSSEPLWLLIEGTHPMASNNLRPHINAFQVRDVTGASIGISYCSANANSSGAAAAMSAAGSSSAAANDLTLTTSNMPTNAFGFFLVSELQAFVMNPAGSQGNLCLGGAIGRYVGPGQIQNAGSMGEISLTLDLTQTPTPSGFVTVQPGETWYFTAWFRDSMGGTATSNFADGLEVLFL